VAKLRDDFLSVVQRKSGLREKREPIRVRDHQLVHFLDAADDDSLIGRFAGGADNFLMVAMADEDQRAAFAREFQGFQMNFGYQRASGINHAQLALLRFGAHARWHAVGAENEHGADGNFFNRFDENGATAAQLINHVAVVHDFVMDVHRIAVGLKREFDDVHGADHAGAKAPGANAYEGLGSVIRAVDVSQSQFVLRKELYFT